ncbi:hypothetical protein Tco_0554237, partial [Tanacetum coccineum]
VANEEEEQPAKVAAATETEVAVEIAE